jgi:hypothetical protein
MAYAPVDVEQFRQAAGAVNKILRGMKPADLPVEEPTRYETRHKSQDCKVTRHRSVTVSAAARRFID